MAAWQLQQAKAHLSQLIREATNDGPQEITVHGKPAVTVIKTTEYKKLLNPKPNLVDFLRNSPLFGLELEIERNKDVNRDIDL